MRKFRVWCEMNNAWARPKCLIDQDGRLFQYRKGDLEPLNPKNHHVQFFTGLLDKSDKEVYVGDIVSDGFHSLPITVNDFHGYRFMWGKDQLYKSIGIDGEIIGNIFEQPGLLKETKYDS
ncbi:unnamed protein product [marine sediment metagenome]|uniref:YopX protein domain-containing protein n=1 Tax=marine sediment metagenome TaxID=412755 RepID=X1ENP0_9ZZZZ